MVFSINLHVRQINLSFFLEKFTIKIHLSFTHIKHEIITTESFPITFFSFNIETVLLPFKYDSCSLTLTYLPIIKDSWLTKKYHSVYEVPVFSDIKEISKHLAHRHVQ